MLLLFWTGTLDGVGVITSTAVLTGIGSRIQAGAGSITCVSVLSADGSTVYSGIGNIAGVSVLLGLADVLTPNATYLITVSGRDGASYAFASDGSNVAYRTDDGRGRVEYVHKPVGRIIP